MQSILIYLVASGGAVEPFILCRNSNSFCSKNSHFFKAIIIIKIKKISPLNIANLLLVRC